LSSFSTFLFFSESNLDELFPGLLVGLFFWQLCDWFHAPAVTSDTIWP